MALGAPPSVGGCFQLEQRFKHPVVEGHPNCWDYEILKENKTRIIIQ